MDIVSCLKSGFDDYDYTKAVECATNINEYDNTFYPLTVNKKYFVHWENKEQYFVEDENGIIEHYDKELFKDINNG